METIAKVISLLVRSIDSLLTKSSLVDVGSPVPAHDELDTAE